MPSHSIFIAFYEYVMRVSRGELFIYVDMKIGEHEHKHISLPNV